MSTKEDTRPDKEVKVNASRVISFGRIFFFLCEKGLRDDTERLRGKLFTGGRELGMERSIRIYRRERV